MGFGLDAKLIDLCSKGELIDAGSENVKKMHVAQGEHDSAQQESRVVYNDQEDGAIEPIDEAMYNIVGNNPFEINSAVEDAVARAIIEEMRMEGTKRAKGILKDHKNMILTSSLMTACLCKAIQNLPKANRRTRMRTTA